MQADGRGLRVFHEPDALSYLRRINMLSRLSFMERPPMRAAVAIPDALPWQDGVRLGHGEENEFDLFAASRVIDARWASLMRRHWTPVCLSSRKSARPDGDLPASRARRARSARA
jgi:hypothetical protein